MHHQVISPLRGDQKIPVSSMVKQHTPTRIVSATGAVSAEKKDRARVAFLCLLYVCVCVRPCVSHLFLGFVSFLFVLIRFCFHIITDLSIVAEPWGAYKITQYRRKRKIVFLLLLQVFSPFKNVLFIHWQGTQMI